MGAAILVLTASAAAAWQNVDSAPPQYPLSADAAGHVATLKTEINQRREAADYAQAVILADESLVLRRAEQPERWHEVVSAKTLVEDLQEMAALSAEAREALAETDREMATLRRLYGKGAYDEAAAVARRQLDVRQRWLSPHNLEVARALNNYGLMIYHAGDLVDAEASYRASVAAFETRIGVEHPHPAAAMNSLALVLYNRGELAAAEPIYRRALAIRRSLLPPNHYWITESLNGLGSLLFAKGDYEAALPVYRESLDIRRETLGVHRDTAKSINNLGSLLRSMGRLDAAEAQVREALAMRRDLFENEDVEPIAVAWSLNTLSELLLERGVLEEAYELQIEALAIRRDEYDNEHRDIATSLHNLARLLEAMGDTAAAEQQYEQALAMCRRVLGNGHPETAAILYDLASLFYGRGEYTAALPPVREAMEIAEGQRSRIVGAELARAAYAGRLRLPEIAAANARVLLALGRAEEAFTVAERGRSRALLDLIARDDRDLIEQVRRSGDSRRVERLEQLLDAEDRARRAVGDAESRLAAVATQADSSAADSARAIEEGRQMVADARRDLGDASAVVLAELRELWPDARPMDAAEIRAALDPGEIILAFSWTADCVMLFVVGPAGQGRIEGRVLADGSDAVASLARLADDARPAMSRRPVPGRTTVEPRDLFRVVLPPDLHDRVLSSHRVVVLPDGPLNGVPLETAMMAASGSDTTPVLLLEAGVQVVYASSATLYVNRVQVRSKQIATEQPESAPSALVVGDPVFGRGDREQVEPGGGVLLAWVDDGGKPAAAGLSRGDVVKVWEAQTSALDQVRLYGGQLPPLPGTRREARRIAGAFEEAGGEAVILLGEDATISRIEDEVAGKQFLHLATHGLTGSTDRPYDASLALTQPIVPATDDIGFLTLDRVIRRWRGKLSSCELVVLSACDTQRGVSAGGNVMSLPWGFFYAGAPSVVASLWKVDDTATMLLMGRFYDNLLGRFDDPRNVSGRVHASNRPMPKADALCEAKQWLRRLDARQVEDLAGPVAGDVGRGVRRTSPTAPRASAPAAHPYEAPHYWAAFILVGAPE